MSIELRLRDGNLIRKKRKLVITWDIKMYLSQEYKTLCISNLWSQHKMHEIQNQKDSSWRNTLSWTRNSGPLSSYPNFSSPSEHYKLHHFQQPSSHLIFCQPTLFGCCNFKIGNTNIFRRQSGKFKSSSRGCRTKFLAFINMYKYSYTYHFR